MGDKGLLARRIIYAALFILSFVFISFRGGNLSYMLMFMMAVNTLASIVYIFYVFYTIKIYQTVPERRVIKKESVPYSLRLNNEGFIAYRAVRLIFMEQLSQVSGAKDLGNIDLEPGQGMNVDSELFCQCSGTYFVGVDMIEIMDYFRIFRIRFHMPQKMKVMVRPRLLKADNTAFIMEEEECRNSGQQGGRDDLIDNEVRKYRPGDNKRLIHWKNSAKRQELMVRSPAFEEVSEYVIIMDGRVDAADYAEEIIICDKLRETMIALVYYIYSAGYHVSYVLNSKEYNSMELYSLGKEILSDQDFDEFYQKCADYSFGNKEGLDIQLSTLNGKVQNGIPFVVISSAPGRISESVCDEARSCRNVHIVDVSLFEDVDVWMETGA